MTHTNGLMANLGEWQVWQGRQRALVHALRRARSQVRTPAAPQFDLWMPGESPSVLVVIEKLTPSCRAAVLQPLRFMSPRTTAVIAPVGVDPWGEVSVPAGPAHSVSYVGPHQLGDGVEAVFTLGAYLEPSATLYQWADGRGIRFIVAQHGLLTPWSPPAPNGATVLAWSDADAAYWSQGRPDLEMRVSGSQMLWDAGREGAGVIRDDRPVMLGQLHGSELTRTQALAAYGAYCRGGGMDYRPHPNENDAISRALHRTMRAGGIQFETSGLSLIELGRPVVSIFSTGTLEAAQRGLPAWVAHPNPPEWVRDFWGRYELAPLGGDPTPAWKPPTVEPALTAARTATL